VVGSAPAETSGVVRTVATTAISNNGSADIGIAVNDTGDGFILLVRKTCDWYLGKFLRLEDYFGAVLTNFSRG